MGASPALVPNPSSSSPAASRIRSGSRVAAIVFRWVQFSAVARSAPAATAAAYTHTVPRNAIATPTEHSTTYFQAASTLARVRRCPTRNAVTMVVASTATHSRPRLSARTARHMQARNSCTSAR
jgi:hypothetical protein